MLKIYDELAESEENEVSSLNQDDKRVAMVNISTKNVNMQMKVDTGAQQYTFLICI